MEKKLKILLIFFSALFLSGAIYFFGPGSFTPQEKTIFIVGAPMPSLKLNTTLHLNGYTRDQKFFSLLIKGRDINPGAYFISRNMNLFELVSVFSSTPAEIWVTVPNGLREEEIAEQFVKEFSWTNAQKIAFLEKAEEGRLFPETYLIRKNALPDKVLEILDKEFKKQTNNLLPNEENALREVLTLASLVQRESRKTEEMATIAGIIQNRIKKGMKLQIDATVQYALGKEGQWRPPVYQSDYRIESDYNTYKITGLPPGPICSPGLNAIQAALFPAPSEYLFYLHDKNGDIHYSKTLEQHNAYFNQYIKNSP